MAARRLLSLGQVAMHFTRPGCALQAHHIRRLFTRHLLPEPPRFCHQRMIAESELPKVEKALIEAGYITAEGGDGG